MIADLTTCLMIALAASSISITVTQTELFAAFREWTVKKNAMLGHLFQCFYCLSHWAVFGGMLVYRPALLHSGFALIDWVMTAFITITLATLINGLMFKVFQAAIGMHVMKHDAQQKLQSHK
ncbi:DUF1360 domain-containing protein [Kosakonia sacchari]|uniref:DUF1360 domain-containing protein n=1 Tax=Kosakonia TaxID=1330547 RepID=UPI00190C0503|nr:DUF1360 domain-containing protein [Kosakonia sp. LAM2021]